MRSFVMLACVAIGWVGALFYDAIVWPKEQGLLLASTLSKLLNESRHTEGQLVDVLNEKLRLDGYSKWTAVQGASKQRVIQIRKKILPNVDLVLEGVLTDTDADTSVRFGKGECNAK